MSTKKVFVGSIGILTNSALTEYFSGFGLVTDVKSKYLSHSIITFEDMSSAMEVIRVKTHVINGKKVST